MSNSDTKKYLIQQLHDPNMGSPEFQEMHTITKSSLIFIPAGMPHMPLSLKRVDRPIFHFSVVMNPEYYDGAYK